MSVADRQVPAEEVLYRRLAPGCDREFLAGDGKPPVPVAFFQFSEQDATGMSLLRAAERHPRWCGLHPRGHMCQLLPFRAQDLYAVGCGLLIEPDDRDVENATAAHCVIPEFRGDAAGREARKAKLPSYTEAVEARQKLCEERIVLPPLPLEELPREGRTPLRPGPAFLEDLQRRIHDARMARPPSGGR